MVTALKLAVPSLTRMPPPSSAARFPSIVLLVIVRTESVPPTRMPPDGVLGAVAADRRSAHGHGRTAEAEPAGDVDAVVPAHRRARDHACAVIEIEPPTSVVVGAVAGDAASHDPQASLGRETRELEPAALVTGDVGADDAAPHRELSRFGERCPAVLPRKARGAVAQDESLQRGGGQGMKGAVEVVGVHGRSSRDAATAPGGGADNQGVGDVEIAGRGDVLAGPGDRQVVDAAALEQDAVGSEARIRRDNGLAQRAVGARAGAGNMVAQLVGPVGLGAGEAGKRDQGDRGDRDQRHESCLPHAQSISQEAPRWRRYISSTQSQAWRPRSSSRNSSQPWGQRAGSP